MLAPDNSVRAMVATDGCTCAANTVNSHQLARSALLLKQDKQTQTISIIQLLIVGCSLLYLRPLIQKHPRAVSYIGTRLRDTFSSWRKTK